MLYFLRMEPGNRIRELRIRAQLSQTDLARRVNLSQGQLSNIENGERNVSLEWLRAIAAALGTSVADLLSDDDNPARLSESEAALVSSFREADPTAQDFLLTTAHAVLAQNRRRTA